MTRRATLPREITVTVTGHQPRAQGSKRLGRHRSTGKPLILEQSDAAVRTWRNLVTFHAVAALRGQPLHGPVQVTGTFTMPRPASRADDHWHDTRPDVDKLSRAVLDALTDALVFVDDGRVARLGPLDALYAGAAGALPEPGAVITVRELDDPTGQGGPP